MSPIPDAAHTDTLVAARAAYERKDWPDAHTLFAAARQDGALGAADLKAFGDAAWWLGHSDECLAATEAAYQAFLAEDQPAQAGRAAIEVAVERFLRGDETLGSAWMARAQRLLEDLPEGPEHGLLLQLLEVEDPLERVTPAAPDTAEAVIASARRVADIGRRHGAPDLVVGGLVGEGRARLKLGDIGAGLALLDEAMLAVLSGDLSPEWAGHTYCHLMSAAQELGDVRRLVAWTDATARWIEGLPAAVLFTGICRVHRSQVHQVTGAWDRAEQEAVRVCTDLADLQPATAAEAHYQVGEIRRLRGDTAGAEEAYQQAHRLGRDPQPGLALLRLAQGRVDAAGASVRGALVAEPSDCFVRARLRAAQVRVALAAGDLDTAAEACEELDAVAARYASSGLEVAARAARGALLLAQGEAAQALPVLRDACRRWQELEAPYECGLVRATLARAYTALGDHETAALELDAAADVFERLGATVDARAVAALRGRPAALPGGLTEREAEVLALVARGRTNRAVARELVISEKTVARHLSNIFTKLGVSSRTAATAYAYEHGVVHGS